MSKKQVQYEDGEWSREVVVHDDRRPMTALDLDAIEAREDRASEGPWSVGIAHARRDIPALVAEVKRLRKWVLEAKLALGAATVIGSRVGIGLNYANHDRLVTEAERDLLPGIPSTSGSPTADLECIQPDAAERDKWGFGE